jgi:CRISPR/Cas system Type II protein with McrA/HNH and RuvC-like nuclease domain
MKTYPKETICIICGHSYPQRTSRQIMCIECRDAINLARREGINRARFIIFERDDFKCIYCGRSSIEDGASLCLDHIMPYSDEWKDNSIYNLITSCSDCNFQKGCGVLSPRVYARIIKRNIRINGGISKTTANDVERILTAAFTHSKDGVDWAKQDISEIRKIITNGVRDTYRERH